MPATMFLVHNNIFWVLATPNNTKYPFWGGIGFEQKFSHLPLLILISILHPNTPGGSTSHMVNTGLKLLELAILPFEFQYFLYQPPVPSVQLGAGVLLHGHELFTAHDQLERST